jgi:UDP-4-amino-4,6-dideoxy-N-acetyl-beta-L-altrosamine N-acetyltransferase
MRWMNLSRELKLIPLVDLSEKSIFEILNIRNQEGVRENMYTTHIISKEEHLAWSQKALANKTMNFFAVFFENRIVGAVSISEINLETKSASWAFYLDEKLQGRGLGSALEFKFLDKVFFEAEIERLKCEVIEFNQPVVALHKRFGFVETKFSPEIVRRDQKKWGVYFLSLTKQSWMNQRLEFLS